MAEKPSPIRDYRQANDLTLEAFGALFGVHKATVLRWEDGELRMSATRAIEIERRTGIPREALRPDLFARNRVA
jgi:DNA-binding transcriptional regulator YdaS (Cro superfamily)